MRRADANVRAAMAMSHLDRQVRCLGVSFERVFKSYHRAAFVGPKGENTYGAISILQNHVAWQRMWENHPKWIMDGRSYP